MTTPATQQKSGSAQGANLPAKNGDQSPVKQSPKGETLELTPMQDKGPLTLEETITKVNDMLESIRKRDVLKNHFEAVSSLRFGDFEDNDQLVLVTHKGEQYPIKSLSLCQEVADLCKRRIKENLVDVEQQIVL
jgi:hypothetical protein